MMVALLGLVAGSRLEDGTGVTRSVVSCVVAEEGVDLALV